MYDVWRLQLGTDLEGMITAFDKVSRSFFLYFSTSNSTRLLGLDICFHVCV